MRIFSLVAFAALALGLTTIGCAADADATDEPAASTDDVKAKKEVVATDADEGKTIKVTEGQDFVLKLGANATTGYKWKVTRTDRSFAYPFADDYQAPHTSAVGAGGTAVMKWHTDAVSDAHGTPVISKVGKHQVTVEYRRSWESATTPAAKTFSITIEIVAPAPPNEGDHGTC